MSKYKLPSGAASIEAVVGLNTEKDYTTPLSKKNIQKALMESLYVNLEQQQEIAELKAELEQHDDQITNIEEANKYLQAVAEEYRPERPERVITLKAKAVPVTKPGQKYNSSDGLWKRKIN